VAAVRLVVPGLRQQAGIEAARAREELLLRLGAAQEASARVLRRGEVQRQRVGGAAGQQLAGGRQRRDVLDRDPRAAVAPGPRAIACGVHGRGIRGAVQHGAGLCRLQRWRDADAPRDGVIVESGVEDLDGLSRDGAQASAMV